MGSKPKGISGSRGSAVLGLNPWTTPFEVWQRIMEERTPGFNAERGYTSPEDVDNASTRWGTAFEDAAVSLTEDAYGHTIGYREQEYGADIYGPDATVPDDEPEMELTCHVDGVFSDSIHAMFGKRPSPSIIYEGKTTFERAYYAKWGEPGTDKIPRYYGVQAQHNMMLSGALDCIVSVLVFPRHPADWEDEGWSIYHDVQGYWLEHKDRGDALLSPYAWAEILADMGYFHLYEVAADKELHAMMRDKYAQWWHKYVIPGIPPKPMNVEDIQRRIPNPSGTVVVSDVCAAWIKEYAGIKAEVGSGGGLAKRLDQLKVLILEHAKDNISAVDADTTDKWIFRGANGDKLASWSKSKKGTFTFRAS